MDGAENIKGSLAGANKKCTKIYSTVSDLLVGHKSDPSLCLLIRLMV